MSCCVLQCVRYMMLVYNFVVRRLRVDVFRRIKRLHFTVILYFPVCKMAAPDFDDDAPLTVGFLVNGVIIQSYIVIFVGC
jgi:hypothetical protein